MCRGRRGRWRSKQREKTRAKDSLQQTKKIFEFMSVFRRMCVAIHHHVAFSHCLLIIINQFWIFNLTYISRPSTNSDCLELRPLRGHSHPTKQNYIMLTLTHHHFLWSVFLLFQQSSGPITSERWFFRLKIKSSTHEKGFKFKFSKTSVTSFMGLDWDDTRNSIPIWKCLVFIWL